MTRLWLWIPRDLLPFSHGYKMEYLSSKRNMCQVPTLHWCQRKREIFNNFESNLLSGFFCSSLFGKNNTFATSVQICAEPTVLKHLTKNTQTNLLLLRAERPYTLSSCQKFISLCGIKCFSFKAAVFFWSCFVFCIFRFPANQFFCPNKIFQCLHYQWPPLKFKMFYNFPFSGRLHPFLAPLSPWSPYNPCFSPVSSILSGDQFWAQTCSNLELSAPMYCQWQLYGLRQRQFLVPV